MAINNIIANDNAINQILSGNNTKIEQKGKELGRDAFLTMLVAQLQHQDPLNPLEGTDFAVQLSQFSSLEQTITSNKNLKAILEALENQGKDNVLDYIGKQIESKDNTITIKNGEVTKGFYTLEEKGPATVMISIINATGNEVKRIYSDQKDSGTYQFKWNGRDNNNNAISDGSYHFEVKAVNNSGAFVPVKATTNGIVKDIIYQNSIPYLKIGDNLVDPNTVIKVSLPLKSVTE